MKCAVLNSAFLFAIDKVQILGKCLIYSLQQRIPTWGPEFTERRTKCYTNNLIYKCLAIKLNKELNKDINNSIVYKGYLDGYFAIVFSAVGTKFSQRPQF